MYAFLHLCLGNVCPAFDVCLVIVWVTVCFCVSTFVACVSGRVCVVNKRGPTCTVLPGVSWCTYGAHGDPWLSRWPGCHSTHWGNCWEEFFSPHFSLLSTFSHSLTFLFLLSLVFLLLSQIFFCILTIVVLSYCFYCDYSSLTDKGKNLNSNRNHLRPLSLSLTELKTESSPPGNPCGCRCKPHSMADPLLVILPAAICTLTAFFTLERGCGILFVLTCVHPRGVGDNTGSLQVCKLQTTRYTSCSFHGLSL